MSYKISEARICRSCSNLVTGDLRCPLCDKPTAAHPDQKDIEGYCQHCTDKFAAQDLTVVTWDEDPYWQDEEGDLHLICEGCREREEGGL